MDIKHTFTKEDNPGAVIPPPLTYLLAYLAGYLIQKKIFLNSVFFQSSVSKCIAIVLIILALLITYFSINQFRKSKNTLISVMPSTSLQTNGIYKISRNPMYVALSLMYFSALFFFGNWWHLILYPVIHFFVQEYNIKREEKYLERFYGQSYVEYRQKTRRWL